MILIRILKNNRAGGMLAFILLTLGLLVPEYFKKSPFIPASGPPPYELIFGGISGIPFLDSLLAVALYLILAYSMIRISVRYLLLEHRSFMPAIFFILFAAALHPSHHISPALVASVFYLFCFAILFEVHDKSPDTLTVFNASLSLAAGSLFYTKIIYFIPLLWIALFTLRSVTFREFIYTILAFILVIFFQFTWFWGIKSNPEAFKAIFIEGLSFADWTGSPHLSVLLYYSALLLLVIIASVNMIRHFQSRKTMVQNIYQVLFFMFVGGLLFFFLIARMDPASLVFTSMPLAFLLSNYYLRRRNTWWHELALWIVFGLLIYLQIAS